MSLVSMVNYDNIVERPDATSEDVLFSNEGYDYELQDINDLEMLLERTNNQLDTAKELLELDENAVKLDDISKVTVDMSKANTKLLCNMFGLPLDKFMISTEDSNYSNHQMITMAANDKREIIKKTIDLVKKAVSKLNKLIRKNMVKLESFIKQNISKVYILKDMMKQVSDNDMSYLLEKHKMSQETLSAFNNKFIGIYLLELELNKKYKYNSIVSLLAKSLSNRYPTTSTSRTMNYDRESLLNILNANSFNTSFMDTYDLIGVSGDRITVMETIYDDIFSISFHDVKLLGDTGYDFVMLGKYNELNSLISELEFMVDDEKNIINSIFQDIELEESKFNKISKDYHPNATDKVKKDYEIAKVLYTTAPRLAHKRARHTILNLSNVINMCHMLLKEVLDSGMSK